MTVKSWARPRPGAGIRTLAVGAALLMAGAMNEALAQDAGAVNRGLFSQAQSAKGRDAKAIVAAECVTCHGMDGTSPVPTFPKLAGMQRDYLVKQLADVVSGERHSPVMNFIAGKYSAQELLALADYFSAQPRTPGVVKDPKLAERGRVIFHEGNKQSGVPACAGCHRPDGLGTPRNPILAGQDPGYVLQQLNNFKNQVRTNDRGRLMRTISGRMSDEEMQAVAQYVAGMPVQGSRP